MRTEKINSLLMLVGADTSMSTVSMIDGLIDFIPNKYLKHFTEYILKNYDKYKKPIVNIATASQEYKRQLHMIMIKKGEYKLESVEDTKSFILEFFKGKEIVNCVHGLYKDFVTIALDEDLEFINKYSNNKLSSKSVNEFLFWCFSNQKRIGEIKLIETEFIKKEVLKLNAPEPEAEQVEITTINSIQVNAIMKDLSQKVRV